MSSFGDFAESWVFCGYRILLYKWERAVVLASSPTELATLARIEGKLREEMAKEKLLAPEQVVLQTSGDDRYAGPLIAERYQVMESFTPKGTYYIADHWREDLLIRVQGPGSDVRRFQSINSAEAYIQAFTNAQSPIKVPDPGAVPGDSTQEKLDMARNPKANADAIKAAAVADKNIGVKAKAKAADAEKQMKAVAKEAKVNGTKPGKEAAPVEGKKIKDVSGRKGTIASMFRELIAKPGKMTDEQIHQKVEDAFGKKIAKNACAHYRADLERRQAAGQSI